MALLTSEDNKNFSLLIARPELQVSQLPAREAGSVVLKSVTKSLALQNTAHLSNLSLKGTPYPER